jgi:hypothetical protein
VGGWRLQTAIRRARKHIAVSLQRASWLTVVIICAIGALVLALNGYVGYPIVVGAVGLSAAVNLF